MIKLRKGHAPDILVRKSDEWLSNLAEAIRIDDKKKIELSKSKYNNSEIKDSLKSETNNKCAYCEGKVSHISWGDIEHMFPKAIDPAQTFLWENMTYACEVCNNNKSTAQNIINPYTEDPEKYISFIGMLPSCKGTSQGRITINTLQLDRPDLTESRSEVFRSLRVCLENIQRARSAQEKAAIIDDFEQNELGASKEYSAMRRDFWKAYDPRRTGT